MIAAPGGSRGPLVTNTHARPPSVRETAASGTKGKSRQVFFSDVHTPGRDHYLEVFEGLPGQSSGEDFPFYCQEEGFDPTCLLVKKAKHNIGTIW